MTYQFLIVDDEYFVRQRIRLCIPWKEYGFECAGEAANVEQALHFLQTVPIDLVLLDISMPGPNGLELLRMMKEKTVRRNSLSCPDLPPLNTPGRPSHTT